MSEPDIIYSILNKVPRTFSYEEKCTLKGKRSAPYLLLKYKETKTLRKFQILWEALREINYIVILYIIYVFYSEEKRVERKRNF